MIKKIATNQLIKKQVKLFSKNTAIRLKTLLFESIKQGEGDVFHPTKLKLGLETI